VVVIGAVAVTIVAGALAVASRISFGWDAGVVASAAGTLARGGTLAADQLDYFARFPNNVPFLAVETLAARTATPLGLSAVDGMIGLQVTLVAVITYCVGATALVLGRPALVLPVQLLAAVLVGWSPHVATPYTDVPAAALVSVAVLSMAHAHTAEAEPARTRWAALSVVAVSAGALLKPYVGVLLVAMAIMALVTAPSWRGVRQALVRVALGGLLTAFTVLSLNLLAAHGTGLTEQRLDEVREPFPVELWVASGTFDSQDASPVRRYGAYNQALVDDTAALEDPQAQRAMLRARITDQITDRGVAGNLRFFAAKVAWVWGDGTFWAHGEGTDSQQPSAHRTGTLQAVSEWTLATGDHYGTRAAVVHGTWLSLLVVVGMTALRAPYHRLHATWALALIGLSAYLMIFEARPRYVLALVPVVIGMALFTVPSGPPQSARRTRREPPTRVPGRGR
jgi:hypothetical protein